MRLDATDTHVALESDCFRAASKGIKELITRFGGEGVNLAELYFESLERTGNRARFAPMNGDVRCDFRAARSR